MCSERHNLSLSTVEKVSNTLKIKIMYKVSTNLAIIWYCCGSAELILKWCEFDEFDLTG